MRAPCGRWVASRASDDFAVFKTHIRVAFGNDTCAPRALEVSSNHLTAPRSDFREERQLQQATDAISF